MICHSETASERIVAMPVYNPDSAGQSRTFLFRGKLDRLEDDVIVDWKTTSDPLAFIRQSMIGFQPELYALALLEEGIQGRGIMYRLLKTPTIRLCSKDATPEAYEDRCVEWLRTTEYALVEHDRMFNPSRMDEARRWLWQVSKRIVECRAKGQWLTNEHACTKWQRECEYLPLCLCHCEGGNVGSMIDEQYEPRLVHEELETGDKDVISYSSASLMTLCERRYSFRYEHGIRAKREETSGAAYLGSVVHVGLDALFTDGLEAARTAINTWVDANPVIGADACAKQAQEVAKANAIVRVAAERWPVIEATADGQQEIAQ
jgi:hypothetical protein